MRIPMASALMVTFSIAANAALAANSAPPSDFAGVPLGSTLSELKSRYPAVSRNPDSDKHFQVYQVQALRGVSAPSPAAFQIYQGRVVGGQIMLDSHNAHYWFDTMVSRYGQPDSCTYCNDAELATAIWHWDNGVSLKIQGEMLTELTSEGAAQRSQWMARGDSEVADNGDETTDEGGTATTSKPHQHRHSSGGHAASGSGQPAHAKATGWRGYYDNMNSRLEHWLGWSK
jgi:hypothetical protein